MQVILQYNLEEPRLLGLLDISRIWVANYQLLYRVGFVNKIKWDVLVVYVAIIRAEETKLNRAK